MGIRGLVACLAVEVSVFLVGLAASESIVEIVSLVSVLDLVTMASVTVVMMVV